MALNNVLDKAAFLKEARILAAKYGEELTKSFESFLKFAYDYPVVVNKKGRVDLSKARTIPEVQKYLNALLKGYFKKLKGRVSLKAVRTTPDPAVDVVLESFAGVNKSDLARYCEYHRVSMAAENKIGDLLELYIAKQLQSEGWFWCCCNIIKGVDFFKPGDPVTLLQVKNRDNSENSSSEKIRELLKSRGCPVKIEKWHRCVSRNGSTCWDQLAGNSDEDFANEDGFRKFLRNYPNGQ